MYSNGDLEFIAQFGHTHEEKRLAKQFLLERTDRDKNPGAWDGAPDNAIIAKVHFYKADKVYARTDGIPTVYTRTLPKTKAREIAERAEREWSSQRQVSNRGLVAIIESAINEAMEGEK